MRLSRRKLLRLLAALLLLVIIVTGSVMLRLPDAHQRLMLAAWTNDTDSLVELIDAGVSPNVKSPLIVTPGDTSLAADPIGWFKARFGPRYTIDTGSYPIIIAIRIGHNEAAALLISKGARIDVRDDLGETPLTAAAREGNAATVRLLLDRGADVDQRGVFGATALIRASEGNKLEVVKLLMSRHANVSIVDNRGVSLSSILIDRPDVNKLIQQTSKSH